MASNPPRFLDWVTDLNLTQIALAVLAFARSQEEKAALLMSLGKLGEMGVQALEVLAQPHAELGKAALEHYGQAKDGYRRAVKRRRLFGFGVRPEDLERESHLRALQDTRELLLGLSLPSLPAARLIIEENRQTVEALRSALLWQLEGTREQDIQGGLINRVFEAIFEGGEGIGDVP